MPQIISVCYLSLKVKVAIITNGQDAIIDHDQLTMRKREIKSQGDYDAGINGRSLRNSPVDQLIIIQQTFDCATLCRTRL